MASTPQLNIRVPLELKEAFIQKAKEDGTTATDLIVGFMQQYLGIEPIASVNAVEMEQRLSELEQRLSSRIATLEEHLPGKVSESGLSEDVERLKAENEELKRKYSERENELVTVKAERDDYAATADEFIKDHKRWHQKALTPEKRDRILNALGVGKQSPQYKRVKAELDKLMP